MSSPLPEPFFVQSSSAATAAAPAAPAAAASTSSPSNSKPRLTLDDITRLFNIPITDAASILGVSTSVLKRLCRKNGIARWPYRLLLSGKTIEDIKREAEIEKIKIQKREEMAKRKTDSKANSTASMGSFRNMGDQNHRMAPGQALQGANRFMAPHLDPFSPLKNVPTYLDEFKLGFPSTGLSSASNKWWGSEESNPEQPSVEEGETQKNPSERLVSLRKRAVEDSRDLIEGKKGVDNCKLNKKQKLVLMQVFGSSLPEQLKNVVS